MEYLLESQRATHGYAVKLQLSWLVHTMQIKAPTIRTHCIRHQHCVGPQHARIHVCASNARESHPAGCDCAVMFFICQLHKPVQGTHRCKAYAIRCCLQVAVPALALAVNNSFATTPTSTHGSCSRQLCRTSSNAQKLWLSMLFCIIMCSMSGS